MAKETSISKNLLNQICHSVLKTFSCTKVYFAESLGHRTSFLTGEGKESFLPKQKMQITKNLIFFYYSTTLLDETKLKTFILERLK